MVNLLKNILPVTVFVLANVIERFGKVFVSIAAVLYNVSSTLHIELGTATGKKLKDIEKSVTDVMKLYASVASKVANRGAEDNRLANLVKNDPNIVQLGKKKDDDTKG